MGEHTKWGGDFSNPEYNKQIEDLEKIRNSGEDGAELIAYFSEHNITITPRGTEAYFDPAANTVHYPNEYSEELTLYTTSNDYPEKRKNSEFTDLAHELIHGQRFNQGIADYTPWKGTTAVKDEIWATHGENKIRYENGLQLRTHYGNFVNPVTKALSPGLSLFDEIKVISKVNYTFCGKIISTSTTQYPYDYSNPQENSETNQSLDHEINTLLRVINIVR